MDESNPSKAAPWLDATAESLTGAPSAEENTEFSTRPLARAAAAVPPATANLAEEKPLAAGSEDSPQLNHYTVKLDAFEGPLDLLLYLIRREEINIWDIPIAHITAHYLEYVQLMKDLNLNLAGEFLVMAATLIHIKSRLLLPPDPRQAAESAEAEDPRHELVYQLLEHEKFKNAAQMLYAKEAVETEVWSKPPREFMEEGEEMIAATLFDVVSAYRDIVQRLAER
ncbi:MAG: segregation/condensation protein A, partial [Acidobacteria bacterium]|nr:segregation/condensation protein A [Acidobacteriota bacterium]